MLVILEGGNHMNQTETKIKKPKSPVISALLNAFPLILGYIYIRMWGRFVLILIIQLFSLFPMTLLGLRDYNKYFLGLVWIISIIDVVSQTKKYNQENSFI
jgi:hypothetical protein